MPGSSAPGPPRLGGHLGLSSPDAPLLAHLGRSAAPLDQINALAAHGFAGVQDLFMKMRPPQEQAAMAARMKQHGLVLSSIGGDPFHWNTPLWSRTDDAAVQMQADSIRESAAIARCFGGAGAVCVAGLDPDRAMASQLTAMAENLKRAAVQAAEAGLVLLIEPIAPVRIPGMLLDRIEPAMEIVHAVAMPSVRLLFDIGHVAMMGHAVADALRQCASAIGLIQAADIPDRVDIGLGTLDWQAILAAIRAIGYAGILELEYEPADQTAAGEAAMLTRLGATLDMPWRVSAPAPSASSSSG